MNGTTTAPPPTPAASGKEEEDEKEARRRELYGLTSSSSSSSVPRWQREYNLDVYDDDDDDDAAILAFEQSSRPLLSPTAFQAYRSQQNDQSGILQKYMSSGHMLTSDACPRHPSVPLVCEPGHREDAFCCVCKEHDEEEEEQGQQQQSSSSLDINKISEQIGPLLLQGFALLDETCPNPACNHQVPLLQDKQKRKVCVNEKNHISNKEEEEEDQTTTTTAGQVNPFNGSTIETNLQQAALLLSQHILHQTQQIASSSSSSQTSRTQEQTTTALENLQLALEAMKQLHSLSGK